MFKCRSTFPVPHQIADTNLDSQTSISNFERLFVFQTGIRYLQNGLKTGFRRLLTFHVIVHMEGKRKVLARKSSSTLHANRSYCKSIWSSLMRFKTLHGHLPFKQGCNLCEAFLTDAIFAKRF